MPFLMSKQMKKLDKVMVTIRLSKAIKKQLDEFALATGRTRGGFIEVLLRDHFQRSALEINE